MDQPNWFQEIPPLTRTYASLVVFITGLCQMNIVSPFNLYFNYRSIIYEKEYWRLITNFLYFGPLGVDFLFYLFFLTRYTRMLEEGSFRGRKADMIWMLFYGAVFLILAAPFVHMLFLGSSLVFMMVYVWSRRNPEVRLSFLGMFTFTAPYLPWVMLGFSLVINSHFPVGDALGIVIGHIYYFFEDVYPITSRTGRRYFAAPAFLTRLLDTQVLSGTEEPYIRPHND